MPSPRDLLARLIEVPGVRAVVLVGREGLLIDYAGRGDDRAREALGALGASALSVTEALGAELGAGPTVGVVLDYEDALVSIDPLGEFATVVTLAENAASLGRIRHTLQSQRDELLRLLDLR
ncbi:MAG: roadblock/LC7 domain-containing protein [Chloroflexota bacterium]|nr:roadblock/LC7 domain-containing protein [Chloroflexota bacterium]